MGHRRRGGKPVPLPESIAEITARAEAEYRAIELDADRLRDGMTRAAAAAVDRLEARAARRRDAAFIDQLAARRRERRSPPQKGHP
jgi:hypothetical protein